MSVSKPATWQRQKPVLLALAFSRIKIATKANLATIAGVFLERTLVALFAESSKDLLQIILNALCRLCQGLRLLCQGLCRLRQFANLIFDTSRRLR